MLKRYLSLSQQVLHNPSWLLYLLLAFVWLSTLGFRHLIPSDEGRYAEIAREMLVSGNWLVPK